MSLRERTRPGLGSALGRGRRPTTRLGNTKAGDKSVTVRGTPENLSDLLGRVSENSTGQINSLIGEFQRLREKLQTDRERIQHEIEEYEALSQQVMQFTKAISESVEKVRASVEHREKE